VVYTSKVQHFEPVLLSLHVLGMLWLQHFQNSQAMGRHTNRTERLHRRHDQMEAPSNSCSICVEVHHE
jgi:hypothetical protein